MKWVFGDPLQAFGLALAAKGIMVLAPDAVGFESRMRTGNGGASFAPRLDKPFSSAEGWMQYYNEMTHRLVAGDLLIRKVLTIVPMHWPRCRRALACLAWE